MQCLVLDAMGVLLRAADDDVAELSRPLALQVFGNSAKHL